MFVYMHVLSNVLFKVISVPHFCLGVCKLLKVLYNGTFAGLTSCSGSCTSHNEARNS